MVVTSFAFLVAGWIQGPPPQPVWYNAVLVGAAVTVAGSFVTSRYAAWRDHKSRREALLASYVGEINVIRTGLRYYVLSSIRITRSLIEEEAEEKEIPEITEFVQPPMPRKVFEETVGILGEIGDAKFVELIANLYAQIDHAEENTRRIAERRAESELEEANLNDVKAQLDHAEENDTEEIVGPLIDAANETLRQLVESHAFELKELRKGHFLQYSVLFLDATTLYVTKELLLYGPRVRATDVLAVLDQREDQDEESQDEDVTEAFQLHREFAALLK